MNIELISWIGVWIILSEIVYLCFCASSSKKEVKKDWFGFKFISFFITFIFMIPQYIIVFGLDDIANYINLLYEVLIIGVLVLFFYLNKKLGEWVQK